MSSIFEKIREESLEDVPNLFDPDVAKNYVDLMCYEELELELDAFIQSVPVSTCAQMADK